jgi:hypothetical protein
LHGDKANQTAPLLRAASRSTAGGWHRLAWPGSLSVTDWQTKVRQSGKRSLGIPVSWQTPPVAVDTDAGLLDELFICVITGRLSSAELKLSKVERVGQVAYPTYQVAAGVA